MFGSYRVWLYRAWCVVAMVAVAVTPQIAGAQTASQEQGEVLTLRTYEVGDLVLNVPDYPSDSGALGAGPSGQGRMGGMGGIGMGSMGGPGMLMSGGPAGGPMSESHPAAITMNELRRVIMTMIEPQTWREMAGMVSDAPNPGGRMGPGMGPVMGPGMAGPPGFGVGGPMGPAAPVGPTGPEAAPESRTLPRGELQTLGGTLLVRQTRRVHDQIENLLTQLREGSGSRRTVSVDARWLVLNSDELDRLASTEEKRLLVDPKVLAEFTRRSTSIRALTNCFSGQLVYLVGGTRRNVVSGYIPVVGSLDHLLQPGEAAGVEYATLRSGVAVTFVQNAANQAMPSHQRSVGYQPVIERPNFGTLLEIRPTLIPGQNVAMADLRSTVTVPGGPTSVDAESPADPLVPTVDRFSIETQQLATTLTVPLGRPVLVGGLTYVGPLPPPGSTSNQNAPPAGVGQGRAPSPPHHPENAETPQLYLVLELR